MVWFQPVPKFKKSGQSLVEVLAAIAVILLILVGIIAATIYSIKYSTYSKNQALATKYAQEGMEEVRSFRDQNPELFWTESGAEDEEIIGDFHRQITYNQITVNERIEVTVIVWWSDASGRHQAKQTSVFTRW